MSDPRDARDTFDARLQRHERLVPPFEDDGGLEPPAELDQIVVARARRALRDDRAAETGPSRTWLPSWGVPVAIAATLVLSFALVLQMSGIEAVQREVAVLAPPAAGPATPAAERRDVIPSPVSPASPASTPSAAPPSRSIAAQASAGRADVPAAAPLANVAAASAETAAAQPIADAAAAASTPPEPAAFEARATRAAAMPGVAAKGRAEASAADAAGAATAGVAAVAPAVAPAAPPPPPPDVRDDPDRWLRDIAELRADGQLEAARRELAAFVARHPTHAVPPDLAELLPR